MATNLAKPKRRWLPGLGLSLLAPQWSTFCVFFAKNISMKFQEGPAIWPTLSGRLGSLCLLHCCQLCRKPVVVSQSCSALWTGTYCRYFFSPISPQASWTSQWTHWKLKICLLGQFSVSLTGIVFTGFTSQDSRDVPEAMIFVCGLQVHTWLVSAPLGSCLIRAIRILH